MNILRTSFGKTVLKSKVIRTNSSFDWYIDFKQIQFYMDFLGVGKHDSILILGCGNSSKVIRIESIAWNGWVSECC